MKLTTREKGQKHRNWWHMGMHAGRGGGVDRYFDGLMREFGNRSPMVVRGTVFGDATEDLPANVTTAGPSTASLLNRQRNIRTEYLRHCLPDQPLPEIAIHFALYGFPLLKYRTKSNDRPAVKIVAHFHGPWANESAVEGQASWRVAFKKSLERFVYRRADLVIADSDAFRQLAVKEYGIPEQKSSFVPAGIDQSLFQAASQIPKAEVRQRLGWPIDSQIIFVARRLVRRMGLSNLIDAIKRLSSDYPNLKLMIAGRGPLGHELTSQIQKLGLDPIVRLLGFVSDEDLPLCYRAADFSIVPSVALEGFGLVAAESLASGTPVLVTPVGGLPEVVGELSKKLILAGSSTDDLILGIRDCLDRRVLLPTSLECTEYASRKFSWKTQADRLLELYESI